MNNRTSLNYKMYRLWSKQESLKKRSGQRTAHLFVSRIGLEHLSPDSELDGGGGISAEESGSLQTDDVWEEHSRMTYLTPRPPAQA